MLVYLCLLIPIFTAIILIFFFRKHVTWWELLILLGITSAFIFAAKAIAINSLIEDTEYLGGYVTEVQYYQAWNERVSCRHPIYCTSCSGAGKTRSCRTYVCGHYHAYDVDYHPEHWGASTTLGGYSITHDKYLKLVKKFGVVPVFKDLHRRYHTIDGDEYFARWQGSNETLEAVTTTETYENKPKAARSIFHFTELDTSELKLFKPQNYPAITDQWVQNPIMGLDDPIARHKLDVLNARLGSYKQLRVYLLVYHDQRKEAAIAQERYWQGANKNEFILCVGLNKGKVDWVYDFSWTEATNTKVDIRTFVEAQKNFDASATVDFMYDELLTKWKRRNFHEFDYLTIEPTTNQITWIIILSLIIDVGIAFWAVVNEFTNEEEENYHTPIPEPIPSYNYNFPVRRSMGKELRTPLKKKKRHRGNSSVE